MQNHERICLSASGNSLPHLMHITPSIRPKSFIFRLLIDIRYGPIADYDVCGRFFLDPNGMMET